MNLLQYYTIIKSKIESNDFHFKAKSKDILPSREYCIKNSHSESINYLMFEFMSDRNDSRKPFVFDYVCIPKDVNVGEMNIDFSQYSVEEFLREIMKLKD